PDDEMIGILRLLDRFHHHMRMIERDQRLRRQRLAGPDAAAVAADIDIAAAKIPAELTALAAGAAASACAAVSVFTSVSAMIAPAFFADDAADFAAALAGAAFLPALAVGPHRRRS